MLGHQVGHADDTDLMTLANGSVTFTGNTVAPAIHAVTIGHADDTDLMTLANGSVTFTGNTVAPVVTCCY